MPQFQEGGRADWIAALRGYLAVIGGGNLLWEAAHLPLYTIWETGTTGERLFAVVHCTGGDLLIALTALTVSLIIVGNRGWPVHGFLPVAALATLFGFSYTIFSEWLNIVVRAAWAYSDYMPVVTVFNMKVGLSPMLQWIVVPYFAFRWARHSGMRDSHIGTVVVS